MLGVVFHVLSLLKLRNLKHASKETIHETPHQAPVNNHHQSTVINMYANVYIGVTIQKLHQLSDDCITRETLSYNNPCPSSPSSTYIYIYVSILKTLLLIFFKIYIYTKCGFCVL